VTEKKKRYFKAPLVQTDIHELGDERLDPAESVHREREALLKLAATRAIPGQKELEDPDRSSGPRIYWRELLRRLEKIAPGLRSRDSGVDGKDTIALYYPKTWGEKINDGSFVTIGASDREKFHNDHRYVGGFDKDYLPFYSHLTLDSSGLPVREVRGVMTVLLMLVRSKIITIEQVRSEFGNPAEDQRGERFLSQIKN
jgi:hypothetical protein